MPGAAQPQQHRRSLRVVALYLAALLREFVWTLALLACAVLIGALLYGITPHDALGGQRPTVVQSLYGGWMALLAQPLFNPPQTWYLTLLCALYPLIGAILIGEGVIRLALLMMSRRRGEKEWIRVMVSTYRDHIVLCGLGNLGLRVLEQLVAAGVEVVVLEQHKSARTLTNARELRVPVMVRDMKEDQALVDAGIEHARAIIIATNDPIGNLEVALDARRMNPDIRVLMRMFDEQIAAKISKAMRVDVAFSSSSLAAPVIAALALQSNAGGATVLSSTLIDSVPHVAVEFVVESASPLVGQTVHSIETTHRVKLLALTRPKDITQSPPALASTISPGDKVIIHAPASKVGALTASSPAPASAPVANT